MQVPGSRIERNLWLSDVPKDTTTEATRARLNLQHFGHWTTCLTRSPQLLIYMTPLKSSCDALTSQTSSLINTLMTLHIETQLDAF